MRARVIAVVAVLALGGCSDTSQPGDAAGPEATTPTTAPTATPDPAPTDATDPALDFGGSSGATVPACGQRRAFLAVRQTFEVAREVRLGEPQVVGEGRLVGEVFLSPATRRERDNGVTSIGDRPGLGALASQPGWDERVPLAGQRVQPGTYAVLLQVAARPGRGVEGVSFPWSDGTTTGSDVLDAGLAHARRCRG
jgi:hypothetical protein